MKYKVTNPQEINCKRLYLDVDVEVTCPECDTNHIINLRTDQILLSYPVIGEKTTVPFYCPNCDDYFDIPFKLTAIEFELWTKN